MMKYIVWFFVIILYIGNNVYIVDTAISPRNLFYGFAFILVLMTVSKVKYTQEFITIISLHLLFFVVTTIYLVIFYSDIEEFKDYYYSTFIFLLPILMYQVYLKMGEAFFKTLYYAVLFMNLISVLILIYETKTGNHLPMHTDESHIAFLPSAFFRNPNDIAALLALTMPFLFISAENYKQAIVKYLIIIITLTGTVLTMSRLSIVMVAVFPIFYYFSKQAFKKAAIITAGYVAVIVFLLSVDIKPKDTDDDIYSKNYNKLITVLNLRENAQEKHTSISTRLYIYSKPFKKPENYILGKGFRGDQKDLSKDARSPIINGHSFFIEMIYNFGFVGFLPVLVIFILIFIQLVRKFKDHYKYRFALILLIYFMLISNVSSSIVKKPTFWLMYSIVVLISFGSQVKSFELMEEKSK